MEFIMTKNNLNTLLKLSEYLSRTTIVFPQGSDFHIFDSLQQLINFIYDGSIETYIPEFDTYYVSTIAIQQSLVDDNDEILMIYMV